MARCITYRDTDRNGESYIWFLIDDPAPTGGRGYVNGAYYKSENYNMRQCGPGEQWG